MPTAEEFDEFYVTSRRRLVLQTFALTGDLGAARVAVRDSYVAARHHWRKVGALADPEGWVRPRAWSIAQRRHTARPWHKERNVAGEQAAVLDALGKLPDAQRRVLILNHLAAVPLDEIGREVGLTREQAEEALQVATTAIALTLDCDSTAMRAKLDSLDQSAGTVKLPRPPIIRRSGVRRRRNHALVGSLLAVGLVFGAGAFVAVGAPAKPVPKQTALVSQAMLLGPAQLAPLTPGKQWSMTTTSDNTRGTGINTTCQASRFADENGLGTWVRKFVPAGSAGSDLVQTVEISNSPGAAKAAYGTTLGWYAGCKEPRLQLVDAFSVTGVGEQAQILRLRIPAKQDRAFVIGVARTGSLTTSTVLETQASKPADASLVAGVLAGSVRNLCASKVAGACVSTVLTQATLPPPSGETKGMLAIADLPVIASVDKEWVGTDATAATVNPAATTCDRTDFVKAGARSPLTRTFLIPQARLPKRFGLTETIGKFANAKIANRFTNRIAVLMKACPDKELGSTISQATVETRGFRGSTYALWRLQSQVNQHQDLIAYWTGIIRAGPYVAQVTLTPVQKYDIDRATFRALLTRARDRLFEVG
jgi:DNA-directed RNA polymerase specialized sigma24 family protein